MDVITIVMTVTLTFYSPESGDGISGGKIMANGERPHIGAVACKNTLPFGTIIVFTEPKVVTMLEENGLPLEYVCKDRFKYGGRNGIDISIPKGWNGMTDRERIVLAKKLGLIRKVRIEAGIRSPPS